jgi:hypothetical protein
VASVAAVAAAVTVVTPPAAAGQTPPPPTVAVVPPYERACPAGAVARVVPFHVIVQATKTDGQPWDGLPNVVRNFRCPSFLVNPGPALRGTLGIALGPAGDLLLDVAVNQALASYVSQMASLCGNLHQALLLYRALSAPFDGPDVSLRYEASGQVRSSSVFNDARPADLARLDRSLAPLTVPCQASQAPIRLAAIDRDVGSTIGLNGTDDPIGSVSTSLAQLGAEAICRGFAYVTPSGSSGIVTAGFRIDVQSPRRDCQGLVPAGPSAPSATPARR